MSKCIHCQRGRGTVLHAEQTDEGVKNLGYLCARCARKLEEEEDVTTDQDY